MLLRHTTVSLCALVAALPAFAQDIDLEDITISGANTEGLFGETLSLQTGTVAKTGNAIAKTPRLVSVIPADQIQERGACDLEGVISCTPRVHAGAFGMDTRADLATIRAFNANFLRDGLQPQYGFYNRPRPETVLLKSVEVLRGPAPGLDCDLCRRPDYAAHHPRRANRAFRSRLDWRTGPPVAFGGSMPQRKLLMRASNRLQANTAQGSPEGVVTEDMMTEIFNLPSTVIKDPVHGHPHVIPK